MNEATKRIEHYLREGLPPDEAAAEALTECDESELREYARPLFEAIARQRSRLMDRRTEDAVMELNPDEDRREDRVSAVKAITSTTFSLPDGRRVSWAEATIADHQARYEWQMVRSQTIFEDARRHQAAADLLRRRRKKRLGQIKDWQEVLAAAVSGAEAAA